MKPILFDISLTGGRGSAKKVYEIIQDLNSYKIPYEIITDKSYESKLYDLGIKANYIVNTGLDEKQTIIINKFYKQIQKIDFTFLVKLGTRVAGPLAARKLRKPYIIIDGGLPDKLSNKERLYDERTYQQAEKFLITTQFEWNYPQRVDLSNIQICGYPLAKDTISFLENLKKKNRSEILSKLESKLTGNLPQTESELLVDIVMTGDYIDPTNRPTYKSLNGWLTSKYYDQCVGFVRRLVFDLASNVNSKIYLFMTRPLIKVISDIVKEFKNVNIITFRKKWNLDTEICMKAVADVTISRATNYQPYIAALEKGCNVTTPVPADGYMDEDSAAFQYAKKGLTKLINYDDEMYIFKLLQFLNDKRGQMSISNKLKTNKKFLIDRNINRFLIDYWKNCSKYV